MKTTLTSIVEQMIRLTDFEYSKDQIKSRWFGNEPANMNMIKEKEKILGIELPEDYKNFLLITNGFHAFSNIDPQFGVASRYVASSKASLPDYLSLPYTREP
jgi:hypothetical protein